MPGEILREKICQPSRSAAKFEFGLHGRSDRELFGLVETIITKTSRAMGVPKRGTICLTYRGPSPEEKSSM